MWKSIYLSLLVLSFVLYCQSQTVSPNNTEIFFQLQEQGTQAGYPVSAQIQPRDANNNPITGCVLGTNPFRASPVQGLSIVYPDSCQPNVLYPYVITFGSDFARNYSVIFTYQNQLVGDSPYIIGFTYGPISSNNTFAIGEGLEFATVGQKATFDFRTHDQFNNLVRQCLPESQWSDFSIELVQSTPVSGQIDGCNNETFTYTASYVTYSTDSAFLYVQYLGNNFNNFPKTPVIFAGDPYGPSCSLSSQIKNVTQAGVPGYFTLECTDQYGNTLNNCTFYNETNWIAFFNSSETPNTFLSEPAVCSEEGTFNFTFVSKVAALYDTLVYYNVPSNAAPSFTTLIEPGPPTTVTAQGTGVQYNNPLNVAGEPSYFSIFLTDQYGNTLTKCFNYTYSDWQISTTPTMTINALPPVCLNNAMVSNWTANIARDYNISIIYQNVTAEGNPYLTNVFPNVFSATKSRLEPLRNSSIGAGLPLNFTVEAFDQYQNPIFDCSKVTISLFSVTAQNLANHSIQITGSIKCVQLPNYLRLEGTIHGTVTGQYNLTVTYNKTQLINSPKTFTVYPGPLDASLSYIVGTGFTNQTQIQAGQKYNFYIYQEDQYNNPITTCPGPEYQWEVVILPEFTSNPYSTNTTGFCKNGIITIAFSITQTGSYEITVYSIYQNSVLTPVPGEGYVEVSPGPFNAAHSFVVVQHEAEIGDQVTVRVTPYDIYGNGLFNCTDKLASDLQIFARYHFQVVATGNMTCLSTGPYNNTYYGTYLANYTGFFFVDVGQDVLGQYIPVGNPGTTNVGYGVFSALYSTAFGNGVNSETGTIVAGTNATVYVVARNKNGFLVPASNTDPSQFSFNIYGNTDSSVVIDNARVVNTSGSYIEIVYSGTIAQDYTVGIFYNGQLLGNEPPSPSFYNSTIGPSVIDLSTLEATNIQSEDSGTGTFDISATDIYGNPVVVVGLDVTLAPACASTNITDCGPVNGVFTCSYSVSEAGIYCITVQNPFTLAQYPVANSTILVNGGAGCQDQSFCNENGVCYYSYVNNKYQCNCKSGYTGDNCDVKIKSHYMNLWLGVGLLIGLSILLLVIGVVIGCLLGRRNRELTINR